MWHTWPLIHSSSPSDASCTLECCRCFSLETKVAASVKRGVPQMISQQQVKQSVQYASMRYVVLDLPWAPVTFRSVLLSVTCNYKYPSDPLSPQPQGYRFQWNTDILPIPRRGYINLEWASGLELAINSSINSHE